jgi:sugar phosphate isomerase/epimerase
MVSFGFQAFSPAQQKALWFWLEDGWHDEESPEARSRAASLIRELAEHAQSNGQQITLEMYEDTYVGTADGAVRFLEDVGHEACGLNPDIGNFVRLHRPLEPVQEMLTSCPAHQLLAREELPARRGSGHGPVMTFLVPMDFGLINYRAAISQAVGLGFRGAFLCEHYGSDAITVIAKNRAYIRDILATVLD